MTRFGGLDLILRCAITILVDLTVRNVEKSEREMVRFRMEPKMSRDFELLFLPADIVRRKSKRDPKEWEW